MIKKYSKYIKESLLDKLKGPTTEEVMNRKYELFLQGSINLFGYFLLCKDNSYPYPEAEVAYKVFKDVASMISVANEYYIWEYLIYLNDVKKIRLKEIANLNATVWRFELSDNLNDEQVKYLEILKQVGCNKNNLDPMDQGYINRKIYKVPSYIFGCKYCGEPQPLKSLNIWSGDDVLCRCEKCDNYVIIGKNNFWYYSNLQSYKNNNIKND